MWVNARGAVVANPSQVEIVRGQVTRRTIPATPTIGEIAEASRQIVRDRSAARVEAAKVQLGTAGTGTEARREALSKAVEPTAIVAYTSFDTVDGISGETPGTVELRTRFPDREAAEAFIATMPKTLGLRLDGNYAVARVDTHGNLNRGERNETGVKRYERLVKLLTEAGAAPRMESGSAFADRAAMERVLTEGIPARPRDPDQLRANAPLIRQQQANWDAAMAARSARMANTGPGNVPIGGTDTDRRAARPRMEGETDRAYEIRTAPSRDAALRLLNGNQAAGLRAIARDEGVVTSGTKADLVARLIRVMRDRHEDGAAIERMVNRDRTPAPAVTSTPAARVGLESMPMATQRISGREPLVDTVARIRQRVASGEITADQGAAQVAQLVQRFSVSQGNPEKDAISAELTRIAAEIRAGGGAPKPTMTGSQLLAQRRALAAEQQGADATPTDPRAAKLAAKRAELEAAQKRFQSEADRRPSGGMRTKSFGVRIDANLRRAGEAKRDMERLEREIAALERPEAPKAKPVNFDDIKPGGIIKRDGQLYRVVKVNAKTVKVEMPPGWDDLFKKDAKITEVHPPKG